MKRIVKSAVILTLALLIPAGIIRAQEKKEERHIKVVVADNSGTKVEIDTLIKGDNLPDSILLKNGKVIIMKKEGGSGTFKHIEGKKGQTFVIVTSDDKSDNKKSKEIRVISGDSERIIESGDGSSIIIINGGKHSGEDKEGKIVTWSSSSSATASEGNAKGEKYIYINENKDSDKKGEKSVNVTVTTNSKGENVKKVKQVISKDGVVVTIEGKDEAKVEEIAKDVESKLGVDKEKKKEVVTKENTEQKTKK